jgi:N-acetylneuraminate lyase
MNALNYSTAETDMALLTAVFTPFDEDGSLALDRVESQAESLVAWNCPGVFVAGTAGEGASLSIAERKALAERWCDVSSDRLDVIVHVGHTSLNEARELAAHAQHSGAHAIASVAPYFHRPADARALADFCGRIAEAAPELPFTYYHIPAATGVHLRASDVLEEAAERIPTFAGVKYAHNDLADLQRCLEVSEGKYEVFVGAAKLLLAAIGVGARAAIGSVYNFAAPLYLRMLEHVQQGDMTAARECQYLAQQVIDAAASYGGELAGFKALTKIAGSDCGPCRPPLASPDAASTAELGAEVERLGFRIP